MAQAFWAIYTPWFITGYFELLGSEGAIYANPSHHGALEKYTHNQLAYGDITGRTPTGGEDGLAATRVLSAMSESAETGQAVDLSQPQ